MRAFLKRLVLQSFLPLILGLAYGGFALTESNFVSIENLVNIFKQASYLSMLAAAQMVVLITRGFDLSVGTVIGLISVACAMVMAAVIKSDPGATGSAIALAWLAGLGLGAAVGAFNGFVVAYLRVSPFMATLGMMGIGLAFATTISGGFPVFDVPVAFVNAFSRADLVGLPVPVAVSLIVLALVYFILNYTVFGRSLYSIGSSPRAAYVAGLKTRLHLALAYVVCSVIVAVVAVMLTARTGSGEPRLGVSLMFESLMAAIIGGVSLSGGEGKIRHCILGALFVTVLSNGMNVIRVDSYIQMMILGTCLIGTIVIDRFRTRVRS